MSLLFHSLTAMGRVASVKNSNVGGGVGDGVGGVVGAADGGRTPSVGVGVAR